MLSFVAALLVMTAPAPPAPLDPALAARDRAVVQRAGATPPLVDERVDALSPADATALLIARVFGGSSGGCLGCGVGCLAGAIISHETSLRGPGIGGLIGFGVGVAVGGIAGDQIADAVRAEAGAAPSPHE